MAATWLAHAAFGDVHSATRVKLTILGVAAAAYACAAYWAYDAAQVLRSGAPQLSG